MRKVLAAAVLLGAVVARGDAWPRGRGNGYMYFGAARGTATEAFDPAGNQIPMPGRGGAERRANAYVELGLNDRLTLVVNAPYSRIVSRGLFNDFTTSGFSDLDFRLRWSHPTSVGVFGFEGGAFIPLGYDRKDFPQLGSGRVEPIINVAYGTSIAVLPSGFVSAQIGYRDRSSGVADELPYSLKLGAFPHPRVGTFLFARGWESRASFRDIDPAFGFTIADSKRLTAGGEVYIHLTRSMDANAICSRVVRGRNTPIVNECSMGIALAFKH